MQFRYYYFLIILIISLVWCRGNYFSIDSKSDTKIVVDFDLENYTIQNIDNLDRIIIDGETISFSEDQKNIQH